MDKYSFGTVLKANKYVKYVLIQDMLKPFEEDTQLAATHYIPHQKILITAEKSRLVKFWELPKQWRDTMLEI